MPVFQYRALGPSGAEISGELVADSERDAAIRLQAVGNFPIEITPPLARSRPRLRLTTGRRLPARDLVLFTRQLAALVGAGVVLDRALGLVAAGRGAPRRARFAADLLAAVNRGVSLSRACAEHPALPSHFGMMIAAGEAHGEVGGALDRLAGVLERSRATSRALLGALVYPASVLLVAMVSVSFLLAFVVPRFEALLSGTQHEPPFMMQFLLLASAVVQQGTLPVLVIALALAGFVLLRWRDPRFREALDNRVLRMPLVGPLLAKVEAERVCFLLGNLTGAGVELPAAVAATAAALAHPAFRAALAGAERSIERGDGVADALSGGGLLPEMAGELIRIGEETGSLSPMLLKAGDILRQEVEATSAELIALITPVSIIVLGLVIGGIAFALLGTVMQVYDIAA